MKKPLSERNEALVADLVDFIKKNQLGDGVGIFWNGRALWFRDYGNSHILAHDRMCDYTEYYTDEYVGMVFDSSLYELLNYGLGGFKLYEDFEKIFEKHGFYFGLGNAWNLRAAEI